MGYQSSPDLSNGESDLYRAGLRVLDSIGRWASEDPAEADPSNPYRVVRNNPVNEVDPSGLQSQNENKRRGFWSTLWSYLRGDPLDAEDAEQRAKAKERAESARLLANYLAE